MTFDEWLRIAEEVEDNIYNNKTIKELYYMKMVGAGASGSDVRPCFGLRCTSVNEARLHDLLHGLPACHIVTVDYKGLAHVHPQRRFFFEGRKQAAGAWTSCLLLYTRSRWCR
jgi:hypothetical protein